MLGASIEPESRGAAPMTVKTYAEQLEEVQTAITNVLTGAQSMTDGDGRAVTQANLETLYKAEQRLRVLADREAGGGGIQVRQATPVDA